jgi:hypothetical protein
LAAASAIRGKQRGADRSRAAEGRVDELSAAQDDPSFGIGQLNAGDGTPPDMTSATGSSTRHGMDGGDPAVFTRARAVPETSDTFNGA